MNNNTTLQAIHDLLTDHGLTVIETAVMHMGKPHTRPKQRSDRQLMASLGGTWYMTTIQNTPAATAQIRNALAQLVNVSIDCTIKVNQGPICILWLRQTGTPPN